MAEKRLFTVTDLGGGDGGKGGIVQGISSLKRAHTVIKIGGAQGSHGVFTSAGQKFNFNQFGCGTFEGAKTHLTELMTIEPYGLLQEAEKLKYQWGIGNIYDYLTVDENALCITPFQTITSQLRELDRKEKPKGTVGLGAGETLLDSEQHPDLIIRAKDLNNPGLSEKLHAIRTQKIQDLQEIIQRVPEFWASDQDEAQQLLQLLLNDEEFIERIVERFTTLASLIKIVGREYLRQEILGRDGVVVAEASHGILTDRYYGFYPHTTKLRTTPEATLKLLQDCGYDGEIIKIAVTRAYQIRHGAGPMVTEAPDWLDKILPNSSKQENRWQGKVRIGPLDLVALRYAIDVCGGPQFFTGLALTWFDQIQALGKWTLCPSYQDTSDLNFFSPTGEIKVNRQNGLEQIEHQKQLTEKLFRSRPNLISHDISLKSREELIEFSSQILQQELKIPVRIISFGPNEKDKLYF